MSKTNKKGKKTLRTLRQRTTADLKKLLAKLRKRLDKVDAKHRKAVQLVSDVPDNVEEALRAYLNDCGEGSYAAFDSMADFSEALALASSDLDDALEQLEELEPLRERLIDDVDAVKGELEDRTHV